MLLWKGIVGVLAFVFRLFGSDLFNVAHRMNQIDALDGLAFEEECVRLLRQNGFYNVRRTPDTGDYGVDIIATYKEDLYAIQCKCYEKNVNNSAVQEAAAGRVFYDTHYAAVMTNSHFTKGAYELAEKNEVLLWNREDLVDMIHRSFRIS